MGIREYANELNTKEIGFEIQDKNFKAMGFWIRSIKNKLRKKNVKAVNMKINVTYVEYDHEE